MNDLSDEDLMNAIAFKNAKAYQALANRYMDDLFFLAKRILRDQSEAEDIVQNVFMLIWDSPKKWQPEKGRFKAWLWTITSNACRDALRKSNRIVLSGENFEDIPHAQASPDRRAEAASELNHIVKQIAALPARQQTALYLSVYDQMTHKEIAEQMHSTPDAVESLIARARKNLHEMNSSQTSQVKSQTPKLWSAAHVRA